MFLGHFNLIGLIKGCLFSHTPSGWSMSFRLGMVNLLYNVSVVSEKDKIHDISSVTVQKY